MTPTRSADPHGGGVRPVEDEIEVGSCKPAHSASDDSSRWNTPRAVLGSGYSAIAWLTVSTMTGPPGLRSSVTPW